MLSTLQKCANSFQQFWVALLIRLRAQLVLELAPTKETFKVVHWQAMIIYNLDVSKISIWDHLSMKTLLFFKLGLYQPDKGNLKVEPDGRVGRAGQNVRILSSILSSNRATVQLWSTCKYLGYLSQYLWLMIQLFIFIKFPTTKQVT